MGKTPLSALIIARNEEKMIGRALESLTWLDDVVVIDAESSDSTRDICAKYPNVRTVVNPWPGFRTQREFSLAQAKNDWVLVVDADEAVSPELRDRLLSMFEKGEPEHPGYKIHRIEYLKGMEVRNTGWNPSYQDRLFNRNKGKYINEVHEYPVIDGSMGIIEEPLLHNPYLTIVSMLRKIDHYTTIEAIERNKIGQKTSLGKIIFAGIGALYKNFIYYKGYRDGIAGFMVAVMDGIARTMRHIKMWEIEFDQRKKL